MSVVKSKIIAKTLIGLLVGLLASLVAVTAMAQEGDEDERAPSGMSAEDIAERVQDFYRETDDFQGAFLQTYTDVAAGEAKRSRGRVYFKKPGMMRWDFYKPDDENTREQVWVSDGEMLWIYEFEFQQVFKECLADRQLPTTMRFLMGQGDLLEEFDVELTDDSTEEAPTIRLTPKEPTSQYRMLEFVIDPETFQVEQTTVYDPYGNTNKIEFINVRINRNLDDSGFEFEPPEGARLLNPERQCE